MKKLKDLLNEAINPQLGKVYSDPYAKSFVKENENEESSEMTTEQKHAFLEAVKAYKSFGETVYRNEGLSEVYESIRGLVEAAGKNMVKETEGSFDGITVSRHVKRMNESFKIFEKTLREVGTLQQRLESSYDEIGETLGKYYEINESEEKVEEGNEFGAARAKAIANGDSEFEVDGKTYPLKSVDKDDKENAKEFTKESVNEAGVNVWYFYKKANKNKNKFFKMLSDFRKNHSDAAWIKMLNYALEDFNENPKKYKTIDDKQNILFKNLQNNKKVYEGKLTEAKESMNLTDILKEGKDVGHYERVGNQTIVDSNFVNYSKGVLPNSELVHLGMGDFAIKSQSGTIKFERSGKLVGIGQDFVGRPHRMTDDKNGKLVDLFLKLMLKKKKAILSMSESVVTEKEGVKHYTKDGKEWTGPTHKMPNGTLMTQNPHSDDSEKLFHKEELDESVNEAKYDIGMARKGNGLTIYNKAEEENGDYKNVALIDNKGKVKYLDKKVPSNIKKEIEAEAKKMMEITNEGNSMIKLKNLMNESIGLGDLPSSKLMKMKMTLAELEASEKVESPINEGFATWEMSFTAMTIGGVELDPKNKYKVKARSTVEAIKKASKEAGLKGDDWMVTQTHSLKKIG